MTTLGSRLGQLWRIFAGITFLNQVIRVPLLLSLASSASRLEDYFIVAATSIPIQFIAQEILQFKSRQSPAAIFERAAISMLAGSSIAYVTWYHGWILGGAYLVFAIAVLLHGAAIGHLREAFPAELVVGVEAAYNTCITAFTLGAVFAWQNYENLGYIVVLAQASAAVLVGSLAFLVSRKRPITITSIVTPNSSNAATTTSIVLTGIMITTQLERLIIAATHPIALACISLAAGITQAWRKVCLDDAIVFQRLRESNPMNFFDAMIKELRKARFAFYPPLVAALVALMFTQEIADQIKSLGILRSLTTTDLALTTSILCIYLSAMPPAIVMINSLRQRLIRVTNIAWFALALVFLAELAALSTPSITSASSSAPLIIIAITASLSHTLLLSLVRGNMRQTLSTLAPDSAIFVITIALVLWFPTP